MLDMNYILIYSKNQKHFAMPLRQGNRYFIQIKIFFILKYDSMIVFLQDLMFQYVLFYCNCEINKFQFFYEGRERERESPTPDISLNPHMSMYQIFIHNNSVDFNPSNSRQNRKLVYLKIHELRLLFFVLYHCSQFTEPPIVYQKFYYIYVYVPFDQ